MKIKKAVIPVAGKGTRFLPASKNTPKEMMPILGVPMIQYVVEEAVRSGIEEIIFITSYGKETIIDYFDRNLELENYLREKNKDGDLKLVSNVGSMVEVVAIRQKEQLGLGHAILCAKTVIGSEPFAVLLGDDIVLGDIPATQQLIDLSLKNNMCSVVGVMNVSDKEVSSYGIVEGVQYLNERTLKMTKMIEKPKSYETASRLATPGRYIFSKEIFDYLEIIPKGSGGEYQLTDAINLMAKNQNVLSYLFEGERYDTGTIENHLVATIEFALKNEHYKKIIQEKIPYWSKKYEI